MKSLLSFCFSLILTVQLTAQTITIIPSDTGIGNTYWSNAFTYILDGSITVDSGQTLEIEPGTVIKAKLGQGTIASSLIIKRGAKIIAQGTHQLPIIFTSVSDETYFDTLTQEHRGSNLNFPTTGLWGGVILLGNAKVFSDYRVIEGFDIPTPYGGTNDSDSSGIMTYVSIRHAGANVGFGNELGALTLAGVGSKTSLNHIEVYAGQDDGIDIYGGKPQLKYVLVNEGGDDAIDYDQGFSGKLQFICALQNKNIPGGGAEFDGAENGSKPEGIPAILNCTFISNGKGRGIDFRSEANGIFANSIIVNYENGARVREDCISNLEDSTLIVSHCVFDQIGNEPTIFTIENRSNGQAVFEAGKNQLLATQISNENPVPTTFFGEVYVTSDPWFDKVVYHGAFAPNDTNWACGWTKTFGNCTVDNVATVSLESAEIYPNPASSQITLDFPESKGTVQVYDLVGNLVLTETIIGKKTTLSLPQQKGIYMVVLLSDNRSKTFKVVRI